MNINMEELFYCPHDIDPNHHFTHYTDTEALKGILKGGGADDKICMWAKNIRYFLCQEELVTGVKYAPELENLITKETYENTYVISLCKNYNSSYMWDEYSKNINSSEKKVGVILFFDTSKMENDISRNSVGHVLYEGTTIIKENYEVNSKPMSVIIHEDIDLSEQDYADINTTSSSLGAISSNTVTKPEKFKKEEEYRVLIEPLDYKVEKGEIIKIDILKPIYRKEDDVYYIEHKFDKNALLGVVLENDDPTLINLLNERNINYVLKQDLDKCIECK